MQQANAGTFLPSFKYFIEECERKFPAKDDTYQAKADAGRFQYVMAEYLLNQTIANDRRYPADCRKASARRAKEYFARVMALKVEMACHSQQVALAA